MNAVRATLPLASTPTGDFGLALSTATTAAVRMSKSLPFLSKPLLSALSTETSDFVPSLCVAVAGAALAAGAARAVVAPRARVTPAAAPAARREMRMVVVLCSLGARSSGPLIPLFIRDAPGGCRQFQDFADDALPSPRRARRYPAHSPSEQPV